MYIYDTPGAYRGVRPSYIYARDHETYWYVVPGIYVAYDDVSYHIYVPVTGYQVVCSYLVCDFIPDHHRGGPEAATKTTITIGVINRLYTTTAVRAT